MSAACVANTVVTMFGPNALPFTAFVLIPFDLGARDVLHERWEKNNLTMRMGFLTLGGSILSWLFCWGSPGVCLASGIAFLLAGIVNWAVYSGLKGNQVWIKMATSNTFAAITDSVVFPIVAFGYFTYDLFLTQAAAKIIGGLIWAYIFARITNDCN